MSSLFCIGANKGLNDFSAKKMIMSGLLLFRPDSLLSYRIAHIYKLWVHKNKGHGASVSLCRLLILSLTLHAG